jgi:hypothetical protein
VHTTQLHFSSHFAITWPVSQQTMADDDEQTAVHCLAICSMAAAARMHSFALGL